MRADEIERRARLKRVLHERVELGVRQLGRDVDADANGALELRNRLVEAVVHRPTDERHAQRRAIRHLPALHPPSIISADPVTKDDSSLARYSAARSTERR